VSFGVRDGREEYRSDWLTCFFWSVVTLVAYYGLATSPTWLLNNPTLLDFKSIHIELFAFILVMALGEISNGGNAKGKPRFDREGALKVALFVMLAVLPEYMQYVMNGKASFYKLGTGALALSCMFKLDAENIYFDGYHIVLAMLFAGCGFAFVTAHQLYFLSSKDNNVRGSDGPVVLILAVTSSVIALFMLSVYLFVKYLDQEQAINCSSLSYHRYVLIQCFLLLLLATSLAMWTARATAVYVYIPIFIRRESITPRESKTANNQIVLLLVYIVALISAYYYREKILDTRVFLAIFLVFASLGLVVLVRGFSRLRNFGRHTILLLLGIIVGAVVTFLAVDNYAKRHNVKMKLLFGQETNEYLDRLNTR
jgi:hypothetical protein